MCTQALPSTAGTSPDWKGSAALALRLFAQDRLTLREDGSVQYTMKKAWKDGTRAIVLQPLDLIARVCAMIPPPRFNMIRFHGVFSPNAKLRAEVVPSREQRCLAEESASEFVDAEQVGLFGDDKTKPKRNAWAWLIRKAFLVDVMDCPDCGGQMKWMDACTEERDINRVLAAHGLAGKKRGSCSVPHWRTLTLAFLLLGCGRQNTEPRVPTETGKPPLLRHETKGSRSSQEFFRFSRKLHSAQSPSELPPGFVGELSVLGSSAQLLSLTNDEKPLVKNAAIEALALQLSHDPDEFTKFLTRRDAPAFYYQFCRHAGNWITSFSRQLLIEKPKKNVEVLRAALYCLAARNPLLAARASRSFVEKVPRGQSNLPPIDSELLTAAIHAIGDAGQAGHVPSISRYLNHGHQEVVNATLMALGRLPDIESFELLLPLAQRDFSDAKKSSESLAIEALRHHALLGKKRAWAPGVEGKLKVLAERVLRALKARDMRALARLVHPNKGLRWGLFGETVPGILSTRRDIIEDYQSTKAHRWGPHCAADEPVVLSTREYINQYLWRGDFTKAEAIGYGEWLERDGLSLIHYEALDFVLNYPEGMFIQYVWSNQGADAPRSLVLVFQPEGEFFWLSALIPQEWCP